MSKNTLRHAGFLLCLWATLFCPPAWGQQAPPITPPAAGTEKVQCVASGVPKTCTTLQISDIVVTRGNSWSLPQTFNGSLSTGTATGNWYSNAGARVVYFPDRLMLGLMSVNPQTTTNNASDWLDVYTSANAGPSNTPGTIATVAALTTTHNRSGIGGVFGAQSLYVDYDAAVVGNAGWCVANRSDFDVQCFGGYFEADLTATAKAGTQINGVEIDAANYKASYGPPNPYTVTNANVLRLACGSGFTVTAGSQFPCTSAININPNPSKFEAGINFTHGALVTQGDGFMNALNLEQGMAIRQYDATGAIVGYDIYNTDNAADAIGTMRGAGFWCVSNGALAGQFCVNSSGTATALGTANSLNLNGSSASNPVALTASGSDTNVDVSIRGKGKGSVLLGIGARLFNTTFAALPTCDASHSGLMAFITDAAAAITAWHQAVSAGGGSTAAFISCNGATWNAFSY